MKEKSEHDLKNKTISGLIWRFGERITAQVITFIVSMVLARIIMPEQYGIIAIVTIFINIANVFVTSGLGTSLVQKKDADTLDFSTMFWASILFSLILYLVIYIIAPLVANLYNNQLLIIVLRVMGLKLPIAAINSIQQAYVSKKMIYKKFFFSTIIGTIVSAFIGIFMAIKGYGVWALVAQYMINSIIDTIVLMITVRWFPKLQFSMRRFKELFSYGWKIMAASFIGTIFDQMRGLIIGVRYTSADLAYNNKGEQIPTLLTNNVNSSMESVLFSSISKVQDDKQKVKNATRRLMKTSSFLIMPLLFGFSAVAEPFIKIVLTDKWLQCVPFIRVVCIQQVFSILNTINMQTIKAIGKSGELLKLEFIKKPIYLAILLITMNISPLAICIGNAVYAVVTLFINSRPNKHFIGYTLKEQIKDVCIYFFIALIMELLVICVGFININMYLLIVIQVIIGGMFYISVSKLFKSESLEYTINTIKDFINRKKLSV